jgi:hypothetical protein
MKLYHIQFYGESYYVEAPSVAVAVERWKAHVQADWGPDYDGTEEPESVALVHDKAVIR